MVPGTNYRGLGGYRVLDLTDDRGYFCGKVLGDLGADVIKIEPPGGDPCRLTGPFYHDQPHPERSLSWWAFNAGKRGVTLDLGQAAGKADFLRLARTADVIIESFTPGHMQHLGLGYEDVRVVNPAIVYVSISAFGQDGPYAHLRAPDIVVQAMGGHMNLVGDLDRPPLRMSVPQAYLHAGSDAATAAIIALWHRERTGVGQHVDVSAQECVLWTCFTNYAFWDFMQANPVRGNVDHTGLTVKRPKNPDFFRCKDGYVIFTPNTGRNGNRTRRMIEWMMTQGPVDEFLAAVPWELSVEELRGKPLSELSLEEREEWQQKMSERGREIKQRSEKYLAVWTKKELWEKAVEREAMLAPINNARDVLEDRHFRQRQYWVKLDHPEVNDTIIYPGSPYLAPESPNVVRRRAPLIGEHNREVLQESPARRNGPHTPPELPPNATDAFAGLKILDFTWVTVGPRCVRYFADHGATVVKVEAPERPDVGRLLPPFPEGSSGNDRSGYFAIYNANKYGMTLDLTKPGGLDIARRLVKWADVLVESFRPGVMRDFGLDYEQARKLNPGIVYASTSMFGQEGPYSAFGGYGYHAAGMCGFDYLTGWPDRTPIGAFWAYTDNVAPQFLASAITVALMQRRRTGKGQYIDQAQNESALHFLTPTLLDCAVNGRIAERNGNRDPNAAPHGAYRCKGEDRWCVIAVFADAEWRTLCGVMGCEELATDARFATLNARKRHEDELDRLVEAWTEQRTAAEVMHLLQARGVAAGVVQTSEDLHSDPQVKHRRHYWSVDHPVIGPHPVDALPFKLSQTPSRLFQREPLLGEHNATVCTDILGMSGDEFVACLDAGVFGQV